MLKPKGVKVILWQLRPMLLFVIFERNTVTTSSRMKKGIIIGAGMDGFTI